LGHKIGCGEWASQATLLLKVWQAYSILLSGPRGNCVRNHICPLSTVFSYIPTFIRPYLNVQLGLSKSLVRNTIDLTPPWGRGLVSPTNKERLEPIGGVDTTLTQRRQLRRSLRVKTPQITLKHAIDSTKTNLYMSYLSYYVQSSLSIDRSNIPQALRYTTEETCANEAKSKEGKAKEYQPRSKGSNQPAHNHAQNRNRNDAPNPQHS
jgi:hypothetical protein